MVAAIQRRGRPDVEASGLLDERILAAATRLFMQQGYAATSMEQIATAASSGKQTVYRRYSSKEQLFTAVVGAMAVHISHATATAEAKLSDPLAALRETCRASLELIADPRAIAVYRIMIAEAQRFPELNDRIVREVVEPFYDSVRHLIAAARKAGQISPDCDELQVGRALTGLITGWSLKQVLLGQKALATQSEREEFFDRGWDLFIKGTR